MLDNDLHNRHAENFSLYLNKDFFFDMMSTALSKSDAREIAKFIDLLKQNHNKVLAINENNFIQLICLLEIGEIIDFIQLMTDHPKVQYRLFKYIEENGERDRIVDNASELYFSLVCRFEPGKVIDYLENTRYDIERTLDLCRKLKNRRGYAYLKYKIGETQETIDIYRELIEEEWECDGEDSYISELVTEILGFSMEVSLYKQHLIKLLGFLSQLPKRKLLKKKLTKAIFERIFSFAIKDFLNEVEGSRQLPLFLEDKILSTYLLLNFKNVVELNNSVVSILQNANNEAKAAFFNREKTGTALVPRNCLLCGNFSRQNNIASFYHSCREMVHQTCAEEKEGEGIECPFCKSRPKGGLIS